MESTKDIRNKTDNELIAEFMDLKTRKISLLSDNDLTVYYKDSAKDWFNLPDYDKSWDSLMPVVEKILKTTEPPPGQGWLYEYIQLETARVGNSIEYIYQCVVSFIHHYNKNKNS